MDGELVDSPSDEDENPPSYTDQFHEVFPYYLSIGMTPKQFWDMDCTLARDYRLAEEYRQERKNQEMWMMGMYVYDALTCASPLFRSFSKAGTKAHPYVKQPFPISRRQRRLEAEAKKKQTYFKGLAMMKKWANDTAEKSKGVEDNGNQH